jgi:hypothetical protein
LIYRLGPDGAYGRPVVLPLTGETAVAAIPGLSIIWASPSHLTEALESFP